MSKKDARSADYQKMIVEAETAVAAVKDPTLRQAAFTTILTALLGRRGVEEPPRAAAAKTANPSHPRSAEPRGPMAYVGGLVDDGYFKAPRTIGEVKVDLATRGHHLPLTSLSGPLQKLVQRKVLRRQMQTDDGKDQFIYSNY